MPHIHTTTEDGSVHPVRSADRPPGDDLRAGRPLAVRLADETGAQAMEYAMLGGAGVASVSMLTWLVRQPWFEEAVRGFVSSLFGELASKVAELLPSFGGLF